MHQDNNNTPSTPKRRASTHTSASDRYTPSIASRNRVSRDCSFIEDDLKQGDQFGPDILLQGEQVHIVPFPSPPVHLYTHQPAEHFQVVRKLGAGSYAAVYLVEELFVHSDGTTSLGREYAVKCLTRVGRDEEDLECQMREAAIQQALPPHPNVVTLYRTLQTASYLLLLLEYVPGQDLFYFLEDGGDHREVDPQALTLFGTPPTPSLLASQTPHQLLSNRRLHLISSMFTQMCDAVASCHRAGVFHRDIKPENFIVTDGKQFTASGEYERRVVVKLTDFGLATRDMQSGDVDCGSHPYMSYECRNNLAPTYATAPADVWSLGVVLLNMLFHQNPWADASKGACSSFTWFLQEPVAFFCQRFEGGLTPAVAQFFAQRVFCLLDAEESMSGSKTSAPVQRISAHEFGMWARNLPRFLGLEARRDPRVAFQLVVAPPPLPSLAPVPASPCEAKERERPVSVASYRDKAPPPLSTLPFASVTPPPQPIFTQPAPSGITTSVSPLVTSGDGDCDGYGFGEVEVEGEGDSDHEEPKSRSNSKRRKRAPRGKGAHANANASAGNISAGSALQTPTTANITPLFTPPDALVMGGAGGYTGRFEREVLEHARLHQHPQHYREQDSNKMETASIMTTNTAFTSNTTTTATSGYSHSTVTSGSSMTTVTPATTIRKKKSSNWGSIFRRDSGSDHEFSGESYLEEDTYNVSKPLSQASVVVVDGVPVVPTARARQVNDIVMSLNPHLPSHSQDSKGSNPAPAVVTTTRGRNKKVKGDGQDGSVDRKRAPSAPAPVGRPWRAKSIERLLASSSSSSVNKAIAPMTTPPPPVPSLPSTPISISYPRSTMEEIPPVPEVPAVYRVPHSQSQTQSLSQASSSSFTSYNNQSTPLSAYPSHATNNSHVPSSVSTATDLYHHSPPRQPILTQHHSMSNLNTLSHQAPQPYHQSPPIHQAPAMAPLTPTTPTPKSVAPSIRSVAPSIMSTASSSTYSSSASSNWRSGASSRYAGSVRSVSTAATSVSSGSNWRERTRATNIKEMDGVPDILNAPPRGPSTRGPPKDNNKASRRNGNKNIGAGLGGMDGVGPLDTISERPSLAPSVPSNSSRSLFGSVSKSGTSFAAFGSGGGGEGDLAVDAGFGEGVGAGVGEKTITKSSSSRLWGRWRR